MHAGKAETQTTATASAGGDLTEVAAISTARADSDLHLMRARGASGTRHFMPGVPVISTTAGGVVSRRRLILLPAAPDNLSVRRALHQQGAELSMSARCSLHIHH